MPSRKRAAAHKLGVNMNDYRFFQPGFYRLCGRILCPLLLITLAACSVSSTASNSVTLPPNTSISVTAVSLVETAVPSPTATPTLTATPVPSASPIATAIPQPAHADGKVDH